jgi:hypothetical protein
MLLGSSFHAVDDVFVFVLLIGPYLGSAQLVSRIPPRIATYERNQSGNRLPPQMPNLADVVFGSSGGSAMQRPYFPFAARKVPKYKHYPLTSDTTKSVYVQTSEVSVISSRKTPAQVERDR